MSVDQLFVCQQSHNRASKLNGDVAERSDGHPFGVHSCCGLPFVGHPFGRHPTVWRVVQRCWCVCRWSCMQSSRPSDDYSCQETLLFIIRVIRARNIRARKHIIRARKHLSTQGPSRVISGVVLRKVGRSWSHFVGIHSQKLSKYSKTTFG